MPNGVVIGVDVISGKAQRFLKKYVCYSSMNKADCRVICKRAPISPDCYRDSPVGGRWYIVLECCAVVGIWQCSTVSLRGDGEKGGAFPGFI